MRPSDEVNAPAVVPDAMSGATVPRRHSTDEILERANAWADRRGYPRVTRATLRELCKDRICEGPRQRGLGQGFGSAWDWSGRDYLRLLRVIALRARGIRRRVDQRVCLFLMGANLPIDDVREAMRDLYRANANRMNHALQTDLWPVRVIPRAVEKLIGEVLEVDRADGFLSRLGPADRAVVASAVQDLGSHPAVRLVMQVTADLWFRPEARASQRALTTALTQLPAAVEPLRDDLTAFLDAGVGLLAPTEPDGEADNAIVDAIDSLSDPELVALRDFVLGWNLLCRATIEALGAVSPDQLGPAEAQLNVALQAVGPALRLHSIEERVVLTGIMATFAARNMNFRRFVQASVEWRLGPTMVALARRGVVIDDTTVAAARDAALEAAAVRDGIRNLLLASNDAASAAAQPPA